MRGRDDQFTHGDLAPELFGDLTSKRRFRRLAWLDLASRELPAARVFAAGTAPGAKDEPITDNDGAYHFDACLHLTSLGRRQTLFGIHIPVFLQGMPDLGRDARERKTSVNDATFHPVMCESTARGSSLFGADHVSRDYGQVRVLAHVSLSLHAGSIHALLGENGAGKSTLLNILAGVIEPSAGHLLQDGEACRFRNVREAQAAGVVALPQELALVPTLGAAENIFLGMREHAHRGLLRRHDLDSAARDELSKLGQQLPLNVPVGELSAVQQTMVALARALARDARVLILDEPTAALTDTESAQLFTVLRRLRDAGTAILYVSHRLDEVFALADTATVLRGGTHVWTRPVEGLTLDDVVTAMIGREHGQVYPARAEIPEADCPVVLRTRSLTGHTLTDASIEARAGRVLGIAGLSGSGRSELVRLIAGAGRAESGSVELESDQGRRLDISRHSLARRMKAGIALVPEERRSQGLVMNATVLQNIALANRRALSTCGVVSRRRERDAALGGIAELAIDATSIHQSVTELSGGNQQKVVLAKMLARAPRVLLLDEPTRGIDIGTKSEIYQLIRTLANGGVAVIVVSSELPELMGISDEIAVLADGHLVTTLAAEGATETSLLALCTRIPA
jgi:ABC-type sugar transport system ATPase subunit